MNIPHTSVKNSFSLRNFSYDNMSLRKGSRFCNTYRISSSFGALVRFRQPSSVRTITSSIRTPNFPGK